MRKFCSPAKADVDYIAKNGRKQCRINGMERRLGGEDFREQFQTQAEPCWDQPMSGTRGKLQQNPANIGAVNAYG